MLQMHIKQNNFTQLQSFGEAWSGISIISTTLCRCSAVSDSAGSVLFLFLSPLTAERHKNIIHCVATCKIPFPTARACGPFPQITFSVHVENVAWHSRIFTQVKWGRDNCLSESANSSYESVHVCSAALRFSHHLTITDKYIMLLSMETAAQELIVKW